MSTRVAQYRDRRLELRDCRRNGGAFRFLLALAIELGELGTLFGHLADQELALHLDKRRACAFRWVKVVKRIGASASRRASEQFRARRDEVALQVVVLGFLHRRIELDEDIAGFDAFARREREWREQRRYRRAGSPWCGRVGMIFPVAVATISTVPNVAQASAKQKTAMIVAPIARRSAGGVSTISSAAGRKATLPAVRQPESVPFGNGMIFLADFMDSGLQIVQRSITSAAANEFVMGAVFDDAATIERDDSVSMAHGR